MARVRLLANLLLVAACCALLVVTYRADAHSSTPARASAMSWASMSATAARAHSLSVEFIARLLQPLHW